MVQVIDERHRTPEGDMQEIKDYLSSLCGPIRHISDEEHKKIIKEKELVDIIEEELPKSYYYERDNIIKYGMFWIYEKPDFIDKVLSILSAILPFDYRNRFIGRIETYSPSSKMDDEIYLRGDNPLLEKAARQIAGKFEKIKGREMIITLVNY